MGRRASNGAWRARLTCVTPDRPDRETAEIFCAHGKAELRHARRALYLSPA